MGTDSPPAAASRPAWFLAIGLVGLAIAIASIADMFSSRPYDGIVPVPWVHEGIEVRDVVVGSPAARAGIRPGECIEGIGNRIVRKNSDASAELRRHKIGDERRLPRSQRSVPDPAGSPPRRRVRAW